MTENDIDLIKFKQVLKESGYSYSKARVSIFKLLRSNGQPTDIKTINSKLNVDRSSIYRSMELFIKLNLAKQVNIGWKVYYELSEAFKPHHHHLICTRCGDVKAVDDNEIESVIKSVANENNFEPSDHVFEIKGICAKCRI